MTGVRSWRGGAGDGSEGGGWGRGIRVKAAVPKQQSERGSGEGRGSGRGQAGVRWLTQALGRFTEFSRSNKPVTPSFFPPLRAHSKAPPPPTSRPLPLLLQRNPGLCGAFPACRAEGWEEWKGEGVSLLGPLNFFFSACESLHPQTPHTRHPSQSNNNIPPVLQSFGWWQS